MSNVKKPAATRPSTRVFTSELEHSYKPNEGGLKPNPPKQPPQKPVKK